MRELLHQLWENALDLPGYLIDSLSAEVREAFPDDT